MTGQATDLWRYAVAVYCREGVSQACIRLQDEFHADVTVLLYSLWLASRGVTLDAHVMANIEDEIGAWRREVVSHLRALRRKLKLGPPPAPNAETEALRAAIKAAELDAEKIALGKLAGVSVTKVAQLAVVPPFRVNLETASSYYAVREKAPSALIDTLVAAAEALHEEN